MSDDSVKVSLELDSADFEAKAAKAKHAVDALGESEGPKHLIEGMLNAQESVAGIGETSGPKHLIEQLMAVSPAIAIIGAAVLALKTTFETVFDAEEIKQVNVAFDALSEQAGITGEKLKESMVEASGGLVSENELLKAANKAIVEMGGSAEKLGDIMAVARQQTTVFGGNLVQNFEMINQAIATGQTRALRHLGLIVDQNKAYAAYAKSIGTAVDALSKAEQSQAIMNAVLEKGASSASKSAVGVREAMDTWTQVKVAFSEIGEAIALAFEKIAGPGVRAFFHSLKDLATDAKLHIQKTFGEGAESAAANIKLLESNLKSIQDKLEEAKQKKAGKIFDFTPGETEALLTALPKKIEILKNELEAARAKAHEAKGELSDDRKPAGEANRKPAEDLEKRRAEQTKFEQDMAALSKARLALEEKNEQSLVQVQANMDAQKVQIAQETAAKIDAINKSKSLSDPHKEAEIAEVRKNSILQTEAVERDSVKRREAALDNFTKNSTNNAEGISRAFTAGSVKAKDALQDFGARGNAVFNSVGKNAVNAFEEMGAGTKSATDAMKGMFLNVLADRAEGEGELLLLSGIWPPNPLALAAGAGLLALGGALRAQAGGGGSSIGGGGGGGGAPSALTPGQTVDGAQTYPDQNKPQLALTQPQKSVTINVQGHYLETDETRQMITNLVRQSSDATDFNITGAGH